MLADPPQSAQALSAAPADPKRRSRWQLLLGAVGVLGFVLPLTQVLRFQVDALLEARTKLERLDPLAETLAVQRGLVAHDEAADRVLRGRSALEDERRQRQARVDHDLGLLRAALPPHLWPQARREADGLQADWAELAEAVGTQRLSAADSQRSHRLLLEQAVQVMDYVEARQLSSGTPLDAGTARVRDAATIEARRVELRLRIAQLRRSRDLTGAALATGTGLGWLALAALARSGRREKAARAAIARVRERDGRGQEGPPASATPAELAAATLQAIRQVQHEARYDTRSDARHDTRSDTRSDA